MRPIDADNLLKGIEELRQSSWYNFGKIESDNQEIGPAESFYHRMYLERKEAVDVIVEQCIDKEPTIENEPVNGWISVKDRLPEYDKTVLVVNEDGYMHTAVRIKGSIARIDEWQIKFGVYFIDNDVWEEDEQGKITHWQPLPEPPKGE